MGWKDKIVAEFTNSESSSGDKTFALRSLGVNAIRHGMTWVVTAMFPAMIADPAGAGSDEVNRLGDFGGLLNASDHKAPLEQTPTTGDLRTAEQFGAIVANIRKRWKKGLGSLLIISPKAFLPELDCS